MQAEWAAPETTDSRRQNSAPLAAALPLHVTTLVSVFDAVPVAMAVWSISGELVHANPVFRDLEQMTSGDLPVRTFVSFVDPNDQSKVSTSIGALASGQRNFFECDFRCVLPDGEGHWVRTMVTALYGPGGDADHFVSQVFDFSNPRTADAQAHRLIDATPVMLWLTDRDGLPRIGNRMSKEFLGAAGDEPDLGPLLMSTLHPDDIAAAAPELKKRFRDQSPVEFMARVTRRDGVYRWVNHRALPYFDANGDFEGYAGASFDMTEAEERRLEFQTAREIIRAVTEDGPIAVIRADISGDIDYATGGWPGFLAAAHGQLTGSNWHSMLTPEQLDDVLAQATASISSREPFTVRVQLVDPDAADGLGFAEDHRLLGDDRWAELRVAPVFDEVGDHSGYVATLADVTTEVISGTRADRLAQVLDAGSDFLLIAEQDGVISYVNDAARQTLGVSAGHGESEPSYLVDVLDPESYTLFREVVEPMLERDGIWRGELAFCARGESFIPVSALFIAHRDVHDRIESISAVARDITEMKDAELRLLQLATHDHLTSLPNRILLYDRLEQALARFHRHHQHVALLYLDLDGFKAINDDLGHHVGDAVLVEIAHRIRLAIRETDTAARIGGDEFAVLVEGMGDPVQLRLLADRLIEGIGQPITIQGNEVQVGVSIGLVLAGSRTDVVDSLMAMADAAMYRAKAAGRGRYEFVGPDGLTLV